MPEPQPFRQQNINLKAGNNPETVDMPVAVSVCPQIDPSLSIPFVVSNWKLTPEEISKINETGEIWVSVMGWPVPPVMIMIENPFENEFMKPLEM